MLEAIERKVYIYVCAHITVCITVCLCDSLEISSWSKHSNMKLFFIIVIFLFMIVTGQSGSAQTTKCPPPPPCFYCLPFGNIDFTAINRCPSCECNPCQYGQPLLNITCGQGTGQCAAANGLCKVNSQDKVYCCPKERAGCCPPPPPPSFIGPCFATCTYDTDCPVGKKCCGNCPRTCHNATLT
jgi:hypothetical protein